MNRIILLTPLLILLCFTGSKAQQKTTLVFSKTFTKTQYIADLDEFASHITKTHPHPYKFTAKADFWKTVAEKKALISDKTMLSEFIWHCSEIIADLGCSHSGLGWFNQEDSMLPVDLRFPLEARLIENRLYISDPLINGDNIKAGAEIFSINGVAVSTIKREAFKHINAQAKITSYKHLLFSAYITAYIPYVLHFPESYEIVIKGKKDPIKLNPLSHYKPKPRYHRIVSDSTCEKELCFDTLDEDTAILTIKNFAYYGNRFPVYRSFINESFKEIRAEKIKHLIIDLRFNGGGPSDAANHLLKYLVDRPFVYFAENDFEHLKTEQQPYEHNFSGKTYILIDGAGQSTTGHFMSLMKELRPVTIIGEELGSNRFCTANQKTYQLSNTGITYSVAGNTFVTTAVSTSDRHGILPDHHVVQTINDHLNNTDTVLAYTLKLIKEEE